MDRQDYLINLISEFRNSKTELEWLEFKVNNQSPDEIGQYISALSNSATISSQKNGYLVWGIEDSTHELVGTDFDPNTAKKGGEPLIAWLSRMVIPQTHFEFFMLIIDSKSIVVLEIEHATHRPVAFSGTEYIRVGSTNKKLKDHPTKEKILWNAFSDHKFEDGIAMGHVDESDVLKLLDYTSYFDMLHLPIPDNRKSILSGLKNDKLIIKNQAGKFDITNLGAILFAKDLNQFKKLSRKAMRVIQYQGNSRVKTLREQVGGKGYAVGFEGLISYIGNLLPMNEVIGKALRKEITMYPDLAIRELVANALVHQDFLIEGTGPTIEIFNDRMEITNPGVPLISWERFLDSPPRSRNEALASMMRRLGVCEERGSGFDKVVFETEFYQLPAPIVEVTEFHTRVVLFSHKEFSKMSNDDKVRATYLHACLKYVTRESMTNSTLRERFGLDEKNSATASRIIKEALNRNMIKLKDSSTAPRYYQYEPYWV